MSDAAAIDEFVMPWGRWKDRPLSEIKYGYLLWLVYLDHLDEGIRQEVESELRRRGFNFGRFQGVDLAECPIWYLQWVRANLHFIQPIYQQIIDNILAEHCLTETGLADVREAA